MIFQFILFSIHNHTQWYSYTINMPSITNKSLYQFVSFIKYYHKNYLSSQFSSEIFSKIQDISIYYVWLYMLYVFDIQMKYLSIITDSVQVCLVRCMCCKKNAIWTILTHQTSNWTKYRNIQCTFSIIYTSMTFKQSEYTGKLIYQRKPFSTKARFKIQLCKKENVKKKSS